MNLSGCHVALVTPFRDGEVDYEKIDELVAFHMDQGTHWILPCGTTGESPTLSHEEHEKVIERVVKAVAGERPVLAGTGSNNTTEAILLTRFAEKIGANAALLITPYYNKPEPEGMYRHFKAIAEATGLPLVLYNVPSRTGRSITADTVARLAAIENVVGIKEASGSCDMVSEIQSKCDITVLSGDDSMTLPLMAVGGQGVISVVANIVPQDVMQMITDFKSGRTRQARERHIRLFPLFKGIFIETNPIPIKAAMRMLGMINGEMRLPLSPIAEAHENALRAILQSHGLL